MLSSDLAPMTQQLPDSACPECGGRRVPLSSLRTRLRPVTQPVRRVLSWPLIALVRAYQILISPLTPPSCRYYPSCSAYALTAVRRFGPLTGTWLAVRRVLRCHPWAAGGVDHVPDAPHTCACVPGPDGPTDFRSSERPASDLDR